MTAGSVSLRAQSFTIDEAVTGAAVKEIQDGDFDLLVVYLVGLDHFLHEGNTQDVVVSTTSYIREQVTPLIDQMVREADKRFHGTVAYAVFPDHGHILVEPKKFMDLQKHGDHFKEAGLRSWMDVLQLDDKRLRVRKTFKTSGEAPSPPGVDSNVIFVPHGGIAHVYVAANAMDQQSSVAAWARPPSLDTLQPLVNSIYSAYIADVAPATRPITDILVRVPAAPDTFAGSEYKVVLAGEYIPDPTRNECGQGNTQPCTLAAQLQPLSALVGRGYADPEERVRDWTSENSGDIVPLANMIAGKYCFETQGLHATHGSLTEADALIPLAVAYPGATGTSQEDDLLKAILELLGGVGMPGNPIKSPTEARTLERFFGVP